MSRPSSPSVPDRVSGPVPHVTGVLETCLHVADVELSARFYERIFGFERMAGDARFCALAVTPPPSRPAETAGGSVPVLQPARSVLLLFLTGGSLQPIATPGGVIPPHDGSGRLHFALAIPADDLAAWEDRLAAQGIGIESRVHWPRGGQSLYFRDPDDHLVELATPGIWPNY